MSTTTPIPVERKPSNSQPKANSFPREKRTLTRVTSAPVSPGDTASFGAELRRRSDTLFHSTDQLNPQDEVDSNRRSNVSSEDEQRTRRASTNTSPDQPRIDAWLEWRKNRRNSSPIVNYGSGVGTSV